MTDRPATPASASLTAGLLALLVLVQVAAASWLWVVISSSWLVNRTNYQAAWQASGFRWLPIVELAGALDARLPPDVPVKLGPRFEGSGQWAQRVKEGLYPRPVTRDAAAVLEFASPAEPAPLVRTPRATFVLTGSLPPPPPAAPAPRFDFRMSWARIDWHAFGALGWGAALALALRRRRQVPLVAGAALAAPVVLGVFGTAATLAQRRLPWTVLAVVGAALGLGAIALEVRRLLRADPLRARLGWLRQPELWGIGLLSAIMVRHALLAPIVGWDGRSIWLYRAKQLAHHGFLAVADAVNPTNFFSHMEYPLLFPTWLAHFAGTPFREREAAIGAMALELALFGYLWWVARRSLGRWVGAAFLGTVWLLTMASTERLYADGLLALFLLAALFSLDGEETEPFGWLALLGAGLTKAEGLYFAAFVAGLFVLLHPRLRARPWLRRLAPVALLLVAVVPPLWARAVGVRGQYAAAALPASVSVALDRLDIIRGGVFKLTRESVPLATLGAALVVYLVLERRGRPTPLSRIMAGAAVAIVVFSTAVLMVTPYDLAEQVDAAMERLLLPAVQASLAAVLLALTAPPADPRPAAP